MNPKSGNHMYGYSSNRLNWWNVQYYSTEGNICKAGYLTISKTCVRLNCQDKKHHTYYLLSYRDNKKQHLLARKLQKRTRPQQDALYCEMWQRLLNAS